MNKDVFKELSKPLCANDIEFRIGNVKEGSGFSLLAYKTARTDVNRLNEVFGMGWKNSYHYDDKGLLCCEISIYSDELQEWVSRVDVGMESHTEAEKGSYSDAFKRAGFKWGIGIELYKFPFIWVKWDKWNGKRPQGFFGVEIEKYEYDGKVKELTLKSGGQVIFTMGKPTPSKQTPTQSNAISEWVKAEFAKHNIESDKFKMFMRWDKLTAKEMLTQATKFYNNRALWSDQLESYFTWLDNNENTALQGGE